MMHMNEEVIRTEYFILKKNVLCNITKTEFSVFITDWEHSWYFIYEDSVNVKQYSISAAVRCAVV